ncbi:MAG TPA: HAD-IA family hydrolase [Dongiaceae bacterium]|jgi:phosphoglycolate phosphatase|nr:HAD-IA family hydrolase [Dongiaceae bacterium]
MTDIGRYRLVVFDCDGTLVDSQHNIVAAMIEAWRRHGLDDPTPDLVRRQVGLTLEIAVARMLGGADPAFVSALADTYREIVHDLRKREDLREPLFEGVRALIEALDAPEIFLGVATGKNMVGLEHTLQSLGLRERFHTLQTADRCRSKPDPEMVIRAMAETANEPESTVVIGDTSFDMEMARAAGATPIGVAWGYHPAEELREAGAVAVLQHPGELIHRLQTLSANR